MGGVLTALMVRMERLTMAVCISSAAGMADAGGNEGIDSANRVCMV